MSKRHTSKSKVRSKKTDKLNVLKQTLSQLDILSGILVDELAEHALNQLCTVISDEIIASAAYSRLHNVDERAYSVYTALIERYKGIMTLYEQFQADITHEQAHEIVSGIIAIITSRVNLAEEHGVLTDESPITTEKKQLAANVVQEFHVEFEHASKNTFHTEISTLQPHLKLTLIQASDFEQVRAATEITDTATKLAHILYPAYCSCCQALTAQLNDIELRRVTNYYLRILEDERHIIESLVKIKVTAEAYSHSADSTVENVTDQILQAIYECYQLFMVDANPIFSYLLHPQEQAEQWAAQVYTIDGFKDALTAKLCVEEILHLEIYEETIAELAVLFGKFNRELEKYLCNVIEQKIGKDMLDKTIDELCDASTPSLLMANKMSDIFRRASIFFDEHENILLEEPGAEIIAGINETVGIKTMSIADGEQSFSGDMQAIFLSFQNERQNLCETILKNSHGAAANKLLEMFFTDKTCNVKKIIDNVLEQENYTTKTIKTASTWQSKVYKRIMEFKRDVLLYEMGTFDEIINYSVRKLVNDINEDHASTLAYAAYLKQTQSELVEMLSRNNIVRIIPEPHTPFNAKEHDVLTAEVTEGFAKGEIVKTFSSGYKENDVALVRATVVAAK